MKPFLVLLVVASAAIAIPASAVVVAIGERPIARAEVADLVGTQFAELDADRSGEITREELDAFGARLGAEDRATFGQIGPQTFDEADIDGDGRIARWEADQRALQFFDLVDMDANGVASIEEQLLAMTLVQ